MWLGGRHTFHVFSAQQLRGFSRNLMLPLGPHQRRLLDGSMAVLRHPTLGPVSASSYADTVQPVAI